MFLSFESLNLTTKVGKKKSFYIEQALVNIGWFNIID